MAGLQQFRSVIEAFNEAKVRYVIVGGLASIAHGYVRTTTDVDMVLELVPDNLQTALGVLASLGYSPRAPVNAAGFADEQTRRDWVEQKGMVVFTMVSGELMYPEVDLFPVYPLPWPRLQQNAVKATVAGIDAPVCGLDDLIELKQSAGRPRDLVDLEYLQALKEERDAARG
ncbi:MAG: hypothetical protein ACFCVE_04580 [Phycisphaerae bacterium]